VSNEQIMNTLLSVVGTNKSYQIADYESSQVVFKVSNDANKFLVRKAVSYIFDVTVVSVNILNCKGKTRRFGKTTGKTKGYKKAIVTLKKGDDIDFGSKSMFSAKKSKAKDKKEKAINKPISKAEAEVKAETKEPAKPKVQDKTTKGDK
jgi:large subunit ribosomal protein L23